jgi:hypothetical protein
VIDLLCQGEFPFGFGASALAILIALLQSPMPHFLHGDLAQRGQRSLEDASMLDAIDLARIFQVQSLQLFGDL